MKTINAHISKNLFQKIYLLYGEEDYLKSFYKSKLRKAMISNEDNMNYHYYEGNKISVNDVIDTAETMPFFAERRLIILENTGFFKKANENMSNYISNIPETTFFIFVENEVDKRSKMYKKVKEIGYVCELSKQSESILCKWVLEIIASENKNISGKNAAYLINHIGEDMTTIYFEIKKLLAYTMDKESIEQEDIDAICTGQITGRIFEMIDAMGNRNRQKALQLYYDLLSVKEPPMRILFMLSRQFNIMLKVREQVNRGHDRNTVSEKLGIKPFVASKTMTQVKNFNMQIIREAIEECMDMEEAIKNGRLDDKMAVEMLLVKYSGSQ